MLGNLIGADKLGQVHAPHFGKKAMEVIRLDAMHQLALIQTQHAQQKLGFGAR